MPEQQTRLGQPVFEKNPSIVPPHAIARKRLVRRGDAQVDMFLSDGTQVPPGAFGFETFEEVDKQKFVKLYLEGVKQYGKLTKPGVAVFELVYLALYDQQDKDHIILTAATSGIPKTKFSRGLRELIDQGFLFRSPVPALYWVNIKFMFNGDRLAFVKSYRIREAQPQLFDDEPRSASHLTAVA